MQFETPGECAMPDGASSLSARCPPGDRSFDLSNVDVDAAPQETREPSILTTQSRYVRWAQEIKHAFSKYRAQDPTKKPREILELFNDEEKATLKDWICHRKRTQEAGEPSIRRRHPQEVKTGFLKYRTQHPTMILKDALRHFNDEHKTALKMRTVNNWIYDKRTSTKPDFHSFRDKFIEFYQTDGKKGEKTTAILRRFNEIHKIDIPQDTAWGWMRQHLRATESSRSHKRARFLAFRKRHPDVRNLCKLVTMYNAANPGELVPTSTARKWVEPTGRNLKRARFLEFRQRHPDVRNLRKLVTMYNAANPSESDRVPRSTANKWVKLAPVLGDVGSRQAASQQAPDQSNERAEEMFDASLSEHYLDYSASNPWDPPLESVVVDSDELLADVDFIENRSSSPVGTRPEPSEPLADRPIYDFLGIDFDELLADVDFIENRSSSPVGTRPEPSEPLADRPFDDFLDVDFDDLLADLDIVENLSSSPVGTRSEPSRSSSEHVADQSEARADSNENRPLLLTETLDASLERRRGMRAHPLRDRFLSFHVEHRRGSSLFQIVEAFNRTGTGHVSLDAATRWVQADHPAQGASGVGTRSPERALGPGGEAPAPGDVGARQAPPLQAPDYSGERAIDEEMLDAPPFGDYLEYVASNPSNPLNEDIVIDSDELLASFDFDEIPASSPVGTRPAPSQSSIAARRRSPEEAGKVK